MFWTLVWDLKCCSNEFNQKQRFEKVSIFSIWDLKILLAAEIFSKSVPVKVYINSVGLKPPRAGFGLEQFVNFAVVFSAIIYLQRAVQQSVSKLENPHVNYNSPPSNLGSPDKIIVDFKLFEWLNMAK